VAGEIEQARRQGALRQVTVPPCPEDLLALRAALAATPPDHTAVARIASGDVALAATLIRHANSAAAAVGPPVQGVGQALDRLGLDTATRLMTAVLSENALPVKSRQLERFWQRSRKRAVVMQHIAAQLPGLSADLAHSTGLMLHVGMVVLLQCVKGYGGTMVEAQARVDRSFIATENANHRTDHAVAGALLARAWRLAPEVMCAIRLHHDHGAIGSRDVEPDIQTLAAATLVAEHLMRRHEGMTEDADWQQHGAAALAWLHLGPGELGAWEEELWSLLDEA
jgi:HD-like signal output (HDOD) protein